MAIRISFRSNRNLWSVRVVKPEWGTKRVCLNCGARFYDLQRESVVCPACGTPYDPAVPSRSRRARAPSKLAVVATESADLQAPVVEADEEVEVEEEEEGAAVADEAEEETEDESESESAIEDVSELGDDDMSDVIDTDLDEDETER